MNIKKAQSYTEFDSTENQPFPGGVCNCNQFRIPGIITLKNGKIFATADARWDDAGSDFGGIDTIFSISDDGGKNWNPGFAFMLPDSDGTPKNPEDATTCIDPCVVQGKDGRVHIFVNINPTGITTGLGWPAKGNGFVNTYGKNRLALTESFKDADRKFYEDKVCSYTGDYKNGYAPIMKSDGTESGYEIDKYFNLYKNFLPVFQKQIDTGNEIQQNIFYRDSAFHVLNTMLTLYLSSADEGKNWDVKIISDEVKLPDEDALISSPGNGSVTESGTILMPFYTFDNKEYKGYALIIYSDDNGNSWKRSAILPQCEEFICSGESKIIPLSENVWRVFLRNQANAVCYADYIKDEDRWLKPVKTEIGIHSDCNLSAIMYNGKIYVSAPAGTGEEHSGRRNGKLYTFTLDESNNLIFESERQITEGSFSYSCMTIYKDKILVLYDTCEEGKIILKELPVI